MPPRVPQIEPNRIGDEDVNERPNDFADIVQLIAVRILHILDELPIEADRDVIRPDVLQRVSAEMRNVVAELSRLIYDAYPHENEVTHRVNHADNMYQFFMIYGRYETSLEFAMRCAIVFYEHPRIVLLCNRFIRNGITIRLQNTNDGLRYVIEPFRIIVPVPRQNGEHRQINPVEPD
uniref:Uncharacterized protein n=1 Tax=Caenorhabditis tropicalis TaxID=1561998 RepID=A0A1I7UAI2_9PELO